MPSKKDKVASYLETSDLQALDEFCKEKDCSRSQGVIQLIREKLINDRGRELKLAYSEEVNGRLSKLEEAHEANIIFRQHFAEKTESIEEYLTDLEYKLDQIQKRFDDSGMDCLTDGQIASVTGRSLEEARNWRMKVRKPRGKNILKALEPYEVVDGLWKKKRVSEHSEIVQQSVQHL